MPRAEASSSHAKKDAVAPNALKRNQACHQCRKKKLKCDAQQPCSSCVKAHAYVLKTSLVIADEPTCTYDSPYTTAQRIQELEAKISALTARLALYEGGQPIGPAPLALNHMAIAAPQDSHGGPSLLKVCPTCSQLIPPPISIDLSSTINIPFLTDSSAVPTPFLSLPPLPPPITTIPSGSTTAATAPNIDLSLEPEKTYRNGFALPELLLTHPTHLIDTSWPSRLPPPDLLHHLIDTFFSCVPLAKRVLHRPTFMNNMLEHPRSTNFPAHAVLHAICAIASLYSPIVTDGNELIQRHIAPDTLFNSAVAEKRWGEYRQTLPQVYTDEKGKTLEEGGFGMCHAQWCMEGWIDPARTGARLVQLLQSQIIICWYFHSVGRAVDLWASIGTTLRIITPLGFTAMDPFGPLSRQPYHELVMGTPSTTAEQLEIRRNLLWLTYSNERILSAGTVWPLMMQDEDISQLLPTRANDFTANSMVEDDRQRLATPKSLITHPPSITDSFTLYVKASVLLGKVKTFNGRFRQKYDPAHGGTVDPRETTEFQMLDSSVQGYKLSFPKEMCDFISTDGKVDPVLHMALMLPHVATILLHDPHAVVESPNCMSAERLLTAARVILDGLYKLMATSFDLLLLDHACCFGWFVCATTLMRFLKVKILAGDEVEANKLGAEIQVVRFMLSNLGERAMCGLRQIMMLERLYAKDIEPLMAQWPTPSNAAQGWSDMGNLNGT
ncbi:hypothetical protein FRB95_012016 [Tulasnella sp. JGI-2019a]|nr:hypothetical protein FRB95_012016 [Tulasnella sp. JGI-2019a]